MLQKAVKRGEIAYIDPRYLTRSKEEKALAELIEKCFVYEPDDRPTIFEVVSYLRNAVSDSLGEEESRVDILAAIGGKEWSLDAQDDHLRLGQQKKLSTALCILPALNFCSWIDKLQPLLAKARAFGGIQPKVECFVAANFWQEDLWTGICALKKLLRACHSGCC